MSGDIIKNLEFKLFLLRREIAEGEIPARFIPAAETTLRDTAKQLLRGLFEAGRDV